MNTNRNLYKMDDFLIIISFLMIIPLIFISWPWLKTVTEFENLTAFFQSAPAILGPRLGALILYGCGAVTSQITGRIIRFKEKQSLEILDTLQFYKKTTVPQLASQLSMSESKISSLVKKMSRINSLGIQIDGETVSIGQAMENDIPTGFSADEETHEQPKTFGSFGDEFKAAVEKANSDSNLTDEEKKEQVKQAGQKMFNSRVNPSGKGKKFNVVLFIILFITPLWPVAIVYAISYAVKQQKMK